MTLGSSFVRAMHLDNDSYVENHDGGRHEHEGLRLGGPSEGLPRYHTHAVPDVADALLKGPQVKLERVHEEGVKDQTSHYHQVASDGAEAVPLVGVADGDVTLDCESKDEEGTEVL